MDDKFILDACCGSRMFWIDKHHPNTIFIDKRKEKGHVDNRQKREINPDIVMDNRHMDFKDKSFKLIVLDPPHIIQKYNQKCRMMATYGNLEPESWKEDIKATFYECWRVLEDYGVLIFKWNECCKPFKEVLELFKVKPLINQQTRISQRKGAATYWATFMKIPEK